MPKGRSLIRRQDALITRLAAIHAAYLGLVRQLPHETYYESETNYVIMTAPVESEALRSLNAKSCRISGRIINELNRNNEALAAMHDSNNRRMWFYRNRRWHKAIGNEEAEEVAEAVEMFG